MTTVVRRRAARVLVIDGAGQILMIHGFDPHDPDHTYWYTVGGGVHVGESDLDAAVREVWEETGRRIAATDLVGPIHADEVMFPFEGSTFVQEQVFFLMVTERYEPRPVAFEEVEVRSTVEIAWINPAGRETAGEQVFPPGLADLLERVHPTAT